MIVFSAWAVCFDFIIAILNFKCEAVLPQQNINPRGVILDDLKRPSQSDLWTKHMLFQEWKEEKPRDYTRIKIIADEIFRRYCGRGFILGGGLKII